MIVIIEGVDGQGKSILCKQLKKDLNFKSIHVSKPKTAYPFLEYISLLNKNIKKDIIFDRFFHGEMCYGPVYRKKSGISLRQFHKLESIIKKEKIVCIYCWTSFDNTKSVFNTRGEKHTKLEDVLKIHHLFKEVQKLSSLTWVNYNWKKNSYNVLIKKIQKELK